MTYRILVVDDDPDIRLLLGALLGDDEIQVDVASDVDAGLTLSRSHRYDLAIVDFMMPGRTGVEFIAATRIRCIGLTAYDANRIVDEMRRAGAVAVCSKPFNLDDLLTVIDTQLGRSTPNKSK